MKIVLIKDEYIQKLKNVESKVLNNYNESRCYLGVVFEIDEFQYFVPLSSPKEKDYIDGNTVKNNSPIMYHLCDDKDRTRKKHLGKLAIGNMIPVPKEYILDVDINSLQSNKSKLVKKQLIIIKKNKLNIINKCYNTRKRFIEGNFVGNILEGICDFKKIEKYVKDTYQNM